MKEIIIRLEDELYEQCKNTELTEENEGFDFHIIKSVANGTVLPKGHGDLIERERLQEVFRRNVIGYAFKQLFDMAPTIIEADKGE